MFVKRNVSRAGGKSYQSVLLVQGKRVPAGPAARGRPRKDQAGKPPKTKVVHETLANLSKLPPELVALVEAWCADPAASQATAPVAATSPATGEPRVAMGACYGVLAGLHALAKETGIVSALGSSRQASLALFLVYARLAMQGSRLGAVRWAEDHAAAEVLGLGAFDEDDLYAALDWLEEHHGEIERALAKGKVKDGAVFLYDVTSSYFEGQCNELAAHGHNRDGKKFKKQLVAGLLTDADGDPVSIELHKGNTADPVTFADVVTRVRERFGAEDMEVVLVGDRGMIKSKGKQLLQEAGFRYVTALTDPQIRKLLREKKIDMELFEETPVEAQCGDKRLILRCNPATRDRERQRRESQWAKVRARIQERNAKAAANPRVSAEASLRQAETWIKGYDLKRYVALRLEGREVVWSEDAEKREEAERLDGCYVIETDLKPEAASAAQVHQRYMDLIQVERDFRTLKTGALELRPVFLRKESRTRGHALAAMLALKLCRALEARVAPLGLTAADAVERLGGVRLLSLGETGLWRLPDAYAPPQAEVLAALPRLAAPVLLSPETRPSKRLSGPHKHRKSS